MGRAEGFTVVAENATAPRRLGQLSVIQGGAEPGSWTETSLERLIRALDLRATGFRRYEVSAAEAQWPAFPASMLVASAVVAAERSFPGVSVGHMSCSFGRPPRADRPVEVAMSEVHIGRSCTTARLTFLQRGASHGEAAVLLRSCPAAVAIRRPRGSTGASRSRPAALPAPAPAAVSRPARRPRIPLVPWDLVAAPAPDDGGKGRESRVWSRVGDVPSDGTLQRALLAYLSELLPVAAAAAVRYRGHPAGAGSPDTVLSHTITYAGPFDLREWLLAAVQSAEPTAGYVHALATFATRQGRTVATVSQAIAVSELQRAAYRCPPQHVPASIRYGSQ
jgi:acyl-CoA thioesterase II